MYRGRTVSSFAGRRRCRRVRRSPPQISMDVEFAQLSDLGRVRQGNEDYLGTRPPPRPSAYARMAGCLCWPTGWAGTITAKWLRARRSKASSAGFRDAPAENRTPSLLARAGANGQQAGDRCRARIGIRRYLHGHHDRRLRAALRSRRHRPCGRFALLSDPARSSKLCSRAIIPSPTSTCTGAAFGRGSGRTLRTRHILSRSSGRRPVRRASRPANIRCLPRTFCCCVPTGCTAR